MGKRHKGNRKAGKGGTEDTKGGRSGRESRRPDRNVTVTEPAESTETVVTENESIVLPSVDLTIEERKNVENAFSILRVTPEKQVESVVALELKPEQLGNVEAVEESRAVDENKENEEGIMEHEVVDEPDAAPATEEHTCNISEHSVSSRHSSKKPRGEKREKVKTVYEWEQLDNEVNTSRAIFIRNYYGKFAGLLDFIDPEVRFAAGVGPCETFDSEGFLGLLNKMKEQKFQSPWPFEEKHFEPSDEELRLLFAEIQEKVKLCLLLACTERCYEFKSIRKSFPITSLWETEIDALKELKTLKVIIYEMKAFVEKQDAVTGHGRFWEEMNEYFEVITPALESFDSDALAAYRVTDSLATLYGRQMHGLEITEEQVYEMLEASLETEGYGDFPSTMLHCPSVFTSARQLKLIVPKLDKMSEVKDIRVKEAGIQAVTQIISGLDNVMEIMEEFRDEPKLSMKKMFGFDPENVELFKSRTIKRAEYLNIFYAAIPAKHDEEYEFQDEQIVSALLSFYLLFPAYEVNMILFKILSSNEREAFVFADKEMIKRALLKLPLEIREKLEVGEEFSTGEITDNQDSMYFQVKNAIRGDPRKPFEDSQLDSFFFANKKDPIVSVERSLRMCIKLIEAGLNQRNAATVLNLLRRKVYKKMGISAKFFEDLLIFALSKYSLPDENSSESKFKFIENVVNIVGDYKNEENYPIQIDDKSVMERWVNLGHHWFSLAFLSKKFSVLDMPTLKIDYPWKSADVWDEKETEDTIDPKKYAVLAKVSLAWPDHTDLTIIQELVLENVPDTVKRSELYSAMKDYVNGQTMSETWKKNLLNKYEAKIKFLSTKKEGKRNGPADAEEKPVDLIAEVVEESVSDQGEKLLEAEEFGRELGETADSVEKEKSSDKLAEDEMKVEEKEEGEVTEDVKKMSENQEGVKNWLDNTPLGEVGDETLDHERDETLDHEGNRKNEEPYKKRYTTEEWASFSHLERRKIIRLRAENEKQGKK